MKMLKICGGRFIKKEPPLYKKINYIFILSLALILILNIVSLLMKQGDFTTLLLEYKHWFSVLLFLIFIAISFLPKTIIQITQVLTLAIAITFTIQDGFESPYGFMFWFILAILLFRYNFFRKNGKVKIIGLILFLLVNIEISASKMNHPGSGIAFNIFLLLFLYFVYFLFKKEIDRVIKHDEIMKNDIEQLIAQKDELLNEISLREKKLNEINNRIAYLDSPEPEEKLSEAGLTLRETEIVLQIVKYHRTNKEIAYQLECSEGTVKQHLHKVFQKLGISTRNQLVECVK